MIIRFIYVYREKATGRAVYVGSAFDVAKRDRKHIKGYLTFDREIRRRGRDAFTLEIVEAFRGDEKDSAPRENQWMDVLKTFRSEGCFNFARAFVQYDSAEHREAAIAAMAATKQTPEARARMSAMQKKHYEDPEARARHSATQKIAQSSSEYRAQQSLTTKKHFEDPEARARHSAAMKIANGTPEARARNSARMKKHFEDPEARARHSAISSTPEEKAMRSTRMVLRHRIEKLTKCQPMLPFSLIWRERLLGAA